VVAGNFLGWLSVPYYSYRVLKKKKTGRWVNIKLYHCKPGQTLRAPGG